MQNSLQNIPWNNLCPWLILVGSLRLAFRFRVLLLATAALLLLLAVVAITESFVTWPPWEPTAVSLWFPPQSPPDAQPIVTFGARAAEGLILPWQHFVNSIALVLAGSWSFGHALLIAILILLQIAIWSAFGGAICRVAALALTRGETPDLPHALRYAKRNYAAFLAAPVMTLIGVFLVALPLVVLGWLMRAEWLAFVAALFWPLVLLLGLAVAGLAIGLALGFPLMWAAIAMEETDAFDAISRAYSYLYQRPLRLLWYVLVAALLGWLGGMAIEMILTATRAIVEGSMAWGIDPESLSSTTQKIIRFWMAGLSVMRAAYYYGYFWCAAVGIYLLLRRDIDSVQLDEVTIEEMAPYTPSGLAARGATAEVQFASN